MLVIDSKSQTTKLNKWADFLISAIRYEDEAHVNGIAYLKVHKDIGEEIGAGSTWSREEVINAIFDGKCFYTIFKDTTGDWKKGSLVSLVTKNGRSIITDIGYTELDYLSNLREL